ncbi:hypothetical protein Tco_0799393 [Tanacetum coccineum]|uniref:Uncharacterized protein n=1 Tax=Tanacetum coccineum TaxID=301880 RepID=A0ABQ4ZTX9_9ASTR
MLVKEKMESQSETTQTVSALKLPVLKIGEYDLWSMRMEQYLTFTDHALWEVIVNGDSVIQVASASAGAEAIFDEHLLKFHACKDAKSLWEAIKKRFGGNKESKKMQKTILKQNYENFVASSQKGQDKTYDRFQKLISQLEIHGEVISQDDANLKLLRSLPSAWNNIALIMRNKSDLDTLSMDDLYNNLKVYESEIKGQTSLSLNSQNVAFVSSDNSSSTNETVNTAHSVSAASSKDQASTASYADDKWISNASSKCLPWRVKGYNENRKDLDLNGKGDYGKGGYERSFHAEDGTTNLLNWPKHPSYPVHQFFKIQTLNPLPYTGNYMPPRPDLSFAGLDESVFKSAVRKTTTSVPETETSISKTSKDIVEKPKTVRIDQGILNNGCSRHMTRNKSFLTDYQEINGGFVAFGGSPKGVADDAGKKTTKEPANKGERNGQKKEGGASNKEGDQNVQDLRAELDKLLVQQKEGYANSTNKVSTGSPSVSSAGGAYDDEDVATQTRRMTKISEEHCNTPKNACRIGTVAVVWWWGGDCGGDDNDAMVMMMVVVASVWWWQRVGVGIG